MSLISKDERTILQLIVSGTHLSAAGGNTEQQIIADGFVDYESIEILQDGLGDELVYRAMGIGLMRFGDVLKRLEPSIVVILGDRYESFSFAAAATVCRIPIAHIHGGELTQGAIDEAFRHSITKMSHLHFTSTEEYRKRVIQLGENPASVFNVGALGVENVMKNIQDLSCEDVYQRLNLPNQQKYFLITYHPVTLDKMDSVEQFKKIFNTLFQFEDYMLVFTGANADQDGTRINTAIEELAKKFPERVQFFISLGTNLYLNAAKYAECVIGNSSSGIIEVPSLGVPVINIGNRQMGRVHSEGVLNCLEDVNAIIEAIKIAQTEKFQLIAKRAHNPYQGDNTAKAIFEKIIYLLQKGITLQKKFFDK
jgi:UDP-hydrolysing UDP-N-acetyl-D-glucosamine 2-epimerase